MPAHPPAGADARRVAVASAIGTTIEWYDFFIYGTAAATVFGPQFFPQVSELAGTLASFATFGIGFIARPLGGVVIEADNLVKGYGDRLLVDHITFKLPPAGIVGVIGPNGAGKSTLFRMITAHEQPD